MFTKLEILNGQLSPKFNLYNDIYTVEVNEEVNSLDINYEVMENCNNISIIGNSNIAVGENIILIKGICDEEEKTTKLIVNKEISVKTSVLDNYYDDLHIKENNNQKYLGPLIGSGCFILILLIYKIIFKRG